MISVARTTPFTAEEHSLLVYLCGQAAVSASNVARHQLLRDAEARLRHQAFHDGLTGLVNRSLFAERVSDAIGACTGRLDTLAVVYLDLDGFKLVNDTLGHDAGDELLSAAARRIRECLRHGDVAGRLGGDEFAVLLHELDGEIGAQATAERLRASLREPFRIADRECMVRASIGIAMGAPGADHESLLRRADLAMYAAKSAGGDRVKGFRPEMLIDADVRAAAGHRPAARGRRRRAGAALPADRRPARRARCSSSRRSSAGSIPSAACCPRAPSSTSPSRPASSTSSARSWSTRRVAWRPDGSRPAARRPP